MVRWPAVISQWVDESKQTGEKSEQAWRSVAAELTPLLFWPCPRTPLPQ
jgi:hypothetical protein